MLFGGIVSILTLDLETIPQTKCLDPTRVNPTAEWLEKWGDVPFADEIASGKVPLLQTGVVPSLHPTTCHIVQVSFGTIDADGETKVKLVQSDHYMPDPHMDMENCEKALLADAFKVLDGKHTLVGFNTKGFDLPTLRWRAALLGLEVPRLPWSKLLYPFDHQTHCDLRLVLGNDNKFAKGTLQMWADAFGVYAEEHGAEVWSWVRDGKWNLLRIYGETETRTLVDLWKKVRAFI